MSKTILLTGGTGLLGSHLGCEFLKRGHRVIYLARPRRNSSARERVLAVLSHLDRTVAQRCQDQIEIWDGDVAQAHLGQDAEYIAARRGTIDEVWHSAAVLHFRDTCEKIDEEININGTANVLDVANAIGARRFHHISTAYVSGTAPGRVFETHCTHVHGFRNPYERTKYDAERVVRRKSRDYSLQTTIYRPAVIVGDSRSGRSLNFTGFYNIAKIMYLIRRALLRTLRNDPDRLTTTGVHVDGDAVIFPLRLPCAPHATVNLVTIDYVVSTMLQLMDTPEAIGQTYHITNPNPPRIIELLREGCRMLNLHGIEFVACSFRDALQLIRTEIQQYARLGLNIGFCLEIREYIHYFFGEPVFDQSNLTRTLGPRLSPAPRITPARLRQLLSFAMHQQWRNVAT